MRHPAKNLFPTRLRSGHDSGVQTLGEQIGDLTFNEVTIPDLWQQEAVNALRDGNDVVVQAPTGSGKTLIFELWSNHGRNPGQAIYTVPTRALANDKLAEWRAKGWDVGIATGDLSDNLDAPVIVATLETQKNRLIRGDGPTLLVVDEYQMLGDEDRGLNYELALALAPQDTRLLLLSGSVENPENIVDWFKRLGRKAVLVRHQERPVPLDEFYPNDNAIRLPQEISGYWPRFVARALMEDLGPILIFAPQRKTAEKLATELARKLPNHDPLQLTPEQKQLIDPHLAQLLKSRIAFHHSGLSYAARAGVIEPLAKAGQLRVVVATMGLAAGINFSLRSVAIAGDSYRRNHIEQPIAPDEILQMFGRAGRRGIDTQGWALISTNQLRIHQGFPVHLSRGGTVDWGALLGLMHGAALQKKDPFAAAVRVQERLFSTKPIFLGVEESLRSPDVPCGFKTDAERARHVRGTISQILNSQGQWERKQNHREIDLGDLWVMDEIPAERLEALKQSTEGSNGDGWKPVIRPALTHPELLEHFGTGTVVPIAENGHGTIYGKRITIADRSGENRVVLSKWLRKAIHWKGKHASNDRWQHKIIPLVHRKFSGRGTPIERIEEHEGRIRAIVGLEKFTVRAVVDSQGIALWMPPMRSVSHPECVNCAVRETCLGLSTQSGVAMIWRRLGLIHRDGRPTRRGQIVSFFNQSNGLAIAAAVEDKDYALDELIYDLANLDAGFRFCGEENRWDGRIAYSCRRIYGQQSIIGYLENGLPPNYGAGAEQIAQHLHRNNSAKHEWTSDRLGSGDIDRMIIEWRSILRQVASAPDLDWPRWQEFKDLARVTLDETQSPTLTELPQLDHHQRRRINHRLHLRRHH